MLKTKYIIIAASFAICSLGLFACWHFFFRTNYKLAVNEVHINPEIPIADIYDWDKSFITEGIDFFKADGSYDVVKLEERMGLFAPYKYYMQKYPPQEVPVEIIQEMTDEEFQQYLMGEHTWLHCEIVDYDRKTITLHYYGTNENTTVDDKWEMDISSVQSGGSADIFLNGIAYKE